MFGFSITAPVLNTNVISFETKEQNALFNQLVAADPTKIASIVTYLEGTTGPAAAVRERDRLLTIMGAVTDKEKQEKYDLLMQLRQAFVKRRGR